jgi:hypothetical protein
LWTATKRILSCKDHKSPIQKNDGSWATDDQEKANLFREHLLHTFTENQDIIYEQHRTRTENDLTTSLQLSLPPKHFSPSDVILVPEKKKAPGYGLISSEILKHLAKKAILFLPFLYNAVLRTTHCGKFLL